MRISEIKLVEFRRFTNLVVRDIPQSAKLVVLVGPNGSGKSSLFDALLLRYLIDSELRYNPDRRYYDRPNETVNEEKQFHKRIKIATHCGQSLSRGSVYVRSAYRNDPEFLTNTIRRQGNILDNQTIERLIEVDANVANNYQRLACQALEDLFTNDDDTATLRSYRNKLIGEIREPLKRIFPDLVFIGVGNPLNEGSFQFDKGNSKNFDYKNLSGGEKAAFDLLLDIVVKRRSYGDAIYCIDEPEMHMNTKLHGALLEELVNLLPGQSQMWIASHSIGMMRKAREMHDNDPGSVAFIDFGNLDFDHPTILEPSAPTRTLWKNAMNVALDDLAALVAPSHVVICEGNPVGATTGKNLEHDAKVYRAIFGNEMPDVSFISAGNSKEIQNDFIGLATALPQLAAGMKISRLIDLDDHTPDDVSTFRRKGITVLSRRHIECYLYDDEVLTALCVRAGRPSLVKDLLACKRKAMADVVDKGFPSDDLKKAAGTIYNEAKRLLDLRQAGNDAPAFARQTLAELIRPGMSVYEDLKRDIFGAG